MIISRNDFNDEVTLLRCLEVLQVLNVLFETKMMWQQSVY